MNLFENTDTPRTKPKIPTPEGVDPIDELPGYKDMTKGFEPSDEQRRVLGFVEQGSGDGLIEAVAGSGKTEVLLGCARAIPEGDQCVICAYNRSVRAEIEEKVEETTADVRTLHSLGGMFFEPVGDVSSDNGVQDDKMWGIISSLAREADVEEDASDIKSLKKICSLIKQACIDSRNGEAIQEVVEHYGEEWEEWYQAVIEQAIDRSIETAREDGVVDYDDLLYLPLQLGMVQAKYDWVLVDEAQDLNEAQQRLTMEVCREDGRRIYVGDRNQAIYGFQGADPKSIDHIHERTSATKLSLNTSFRCPRSHVEKAQEFVPQIRPAEKAVEGTLQGLPIESLPSQVEPGDLVLSRTNKALVKWCIKVGLQGTPAFIRGKDLADDIKGTVERFLGRHSGSSDQSPIEFLRANIDRFADEAEQIAKGEKNIDPEKLEDRIEIIGVILENYKPSSTSALEREIENLFSEGEEKVEFSTIHKAKGDENDCVFVVNPWHTPSQVTKDWEKEQEDNLKYVMLTRSKATLILATEEEESETSDVDRASSEGFVRLRKENVEPGDTLAHKKFGRGEVLAVQKASRGYIAMRFFEQEDPFREVEISRPAFKWV